MARRKHKPFGGELEVERGAKDPLSQHVPSPVSSLPTLAADGITRRMNGADRPSATTRAVGYAVLGGLGIVALWALRLTSPEWVAQLSEFRAFPYLIVAVSSVAAFGVLDLVFGPVSIAPPTTGDAPFGGYVAAKGEETMWKRRLFSIGLGLIHTAVFLWA